MRSASRTVLAFGFVVLAGVAAAEPASARVHHRHRGHRAPHQFVFPTPQDGQLASGIGAFLGDNPIGLPGATTADPYEHPAFGYDTNGRYGPGYVYPGY